MRSKPMTTSHSYHLVFEWDNVISYAKNQISLRQLLKSLHPFKITVIKESKKKLLGIFKKFEKKPHLWRELIFQYAKTLEPDNPKKQYNVAIQLTQQYQKNAHYKLKENYQNKNSICAESALNHLKRIGVKLYLCGDTSRKDLLREVKEAGLLSYFKGIYGYPVKKNDLLSYLIKNNYTEKEKVILIDDSHKITHLCRASGFHALQFIKTKSARVSQKNNQYITLKELSHPNIINTIKSKISYHSSNTPKERIKRFISEDNVKLKKITRNHTSLSLWHFKSEQGNYFIKELSMNTKCANEIGKILVYLHKNDIPVAPWIKPIKSKDFFIEDPYHRYISVMEKSLPGKPLTVQQKKQKNLLNRLLSPWQKFMIDSKK